MAILTSKAAEFGAKKIPILLSKIPCVLKKITVWWALWVTRIISRNGPVNWPLHSCDLTLLDYFLWEFVKSKVCCNKPETLLQLEENIRQVIGEIKPELLRTVCDYWTSRLRHVRETRGGASCRKLFLSTKWYRITFVMVSNIWIYHIIFFVFY